MLGVLREGEALTEDAQKGVKDLCAGQKLANHLVLTALLTEGLYGASFDLSSMERGELYHDRCMVLLLADYMQDIGAAELNANRDVQALYLSAGFGHRPSFEKRGIRVDAQVYGFKRFANLSSE